MEDVSWVCNACTFGNEATFDTCAMCDTSKPACSWFFHSYRRSLSMCSVFGFLTNILSGALTCVFALVGFLVGAIFRASTRHTAHIGLLREAGLGAVMGAVLFIEVLEASRAYWHSQRSGSNLFLSMTRLLKDIFNGRFLREFLCPSLFAAQRWQASFLEASYEEMYDMLMPVEGRTKGASQEYLRSLPHHSVTQGSRKDVQGDVICCTICLQELEEGDIARTLPTCKHTFHMKCVDEWLSRRLLCPVCRQYM